jgi:MFS family permease
MAVGPNTSAAVLSPHVWRNLVAAVAMVFVCDMALGLTYPLLNVIMEKRGVDAWLIGVNSAMGPLGIIAAGLVLPRLLARLHSGPVAWAGLVLLVVTLLMFGLSDDFWFWCAVRFMLGVGIAILFSVSEAWLMHFSPDEHRGKITAVYTTVMALGFGAGAALLPIAGTQGMLPFTIAAAMIAGGAVPLLFLRLDGKEFHGEAHGASMMAFAIAAPLLLAGILTMTLFDSVMLSFFPIYALREGLDLTRGAWVLSAAITGAALLQVPVGWLADRWSRNGVIWLCTVTTVVLSLVMPHVLNSWLVWPLAIVLGTAAYSIYALALVALGDRFKGPMLVAGSAAVAAMWGIGGIAGPPVTGWAFSAAGHETMPWLLAAPYAVFAVAFALAGGHLVRMKWRQPPPR